LAEHVLEHLARLRTACKKVAKFATSLFAFHFEKKLEP